MRLSLTSLTLTSLLVVSDSFLPPSPLPFLVRSATTLRPPRAANPPLRPSLRAKGGDDAEDEDAEDDELPTTNTDWGGALASLRSRISSIESGRVGGPSVLFDLVSSMTPSQVIADFVETAQPLVINAMSDAVASLIGGIGSNPAMGVDVTATVKGEKLGALCFQLQMTGYMFRNAEYVLALKDLMSISEHSVEEYRGAFMKIDKDGSGYIDKDEIKAMLEELYGEDPPAFEQQTFLKFFDTDNDGKISWEEFEKGLGVVNADRAAGSVARSLISGSDDGDGDADGGLPPPTISGTLTVELDDGSTMEVEANDYIRTLRREAEALKSALASELASDAEGLGSMTAGLDPGRPSAGGGLGGYLASLDKDNVRALTEGITPDVLETMKMLVKFVLDGGPNKAGKIENDQEVEIPVGALKQLCLWQLILGYRLRENEATGEYKDRLGR